MKRRAYRATRKRINALGEKWIRPLGLKWWTVRLHLYKSRGKYAESTGCDPKTSAAMCETDWRYRRADIHFNGPAWHEMDDDEAEHNFVHELCHIFLGELRTSADDAHDHEERVCQTLADAFVWARDWDKTTPVEQPKDK